jgi:recA bacterial DNA recombination protein
MRRHRLNSGQAALDAIIDGGIVRGRISEIIGPIGSGFTTIAARFVSGATRADEVIARIESARSFDPADIAAGSTSLNPGLVGFDHVHCANNILCHEAGGLPLCALVSTTCCHRQAIRHPSPFRGRTSCEDTRCGYAIT